MTSVTVYLTTMRQDKTVPVSEMDTVLMDGACVIIHCLLLLADDSALEG